MKILLLNNNPVVNKLVTLSVQKTSDELSIAESVEAIRPKNYDLLIVDDAFYDENFMEDVGSKIKFNKSLFICAKDAKFTEEFTRILKKPFLPTDLVEVLISLGKMVDTIELDKMEETHDAEMDSLNDLDEIDGLDDLDEFEGLDEIEGIDELDDLDEKLKSKPIEEELDLDELDENEEFDEFDEFEDLESDGRKEADGILDKDELQEVQNLLEETEMEEDLGFDDSNSELEDFKEPKVEEKEAEEIEAEEPADDLAFDESDLELEDFEEEVSSDESEPVDDFEDLASQIESAVQALSDEDLQTEVDQDLLFNIDSLNSRDLKLAIGEEVNDEEFDESEIVDEEEPHDEEFEEDFSNNADSSSKSGNEGVEALKKLLKALSNEDVAASLKGMKISINITLGDK